MASYELNKEVRSTPNRIDQWRISTLVLLALGLGCYLGWQTIDISPTLFASPHEGVAEVIDAWGYPYMALFVTALAALALLARSRGSLLSHRWIILLTSIGTATATAVLYLAGWVVDPAVISLVIIGKICFFLSAGFVVLWGEALCIIPGRSIITCVAGAYATSFALCLVVADLAPIGAMVLRCVLPLLSGAALFAFIRDAQSADVLTPARGTSYANDSIDDKLPIISTTPWRLFCGIAILGAVFTVTNHLSETKTEVSTELYTLFAGITVALVILFASPLAHLKNRDFTVLYRLITPMVIGALLLTLVLQQGFQRYEALAIGAAWVFFRIFTWTLWAHIGARSPQHGGYVFAVGQIFLAIGSTLAEVISARVDLASAPLAASVALIVFVTVITSALVMDEGSITRFVSSKSEREDHDEPLDIQSITVRDLEHATSAFDLSERERELALLVVQRNDNRQICDIACITESTLRTHLRNIYAKTNTHSRLELIDTLEQLLRQQQSI